MTLTPSARIGRRAYAHSHPKRLLVVLAPFSAVVIKRHFGRIADQLRKRLDQTADTRKPNSSNCANLRKLLPRTWMHQPHCHIAFRPKSPKLKPRQFNCGKPMKRKLLGATSPWNYRVGAIYPLGHGTLNRPCA